MSDICIIGWHAGWKSWYPQSPCRWCLVSEYPPLRSRSERRIWFCFCATAWGYGISQTEFRISLRCFLWCGEGQCLFQRMWKAVFPVPSADRKRYPIRNGDPAKFDSSAKRNRKHSHRCFENPEYSREKNIEIYARNMRFAWFQITECIPCVYSLCSKRIKKKICTN